MRSSSSVRRNTPDAPRPFCAPASIMRFDLFHRGVAPVVITTGGAAADPTFSEGGVGRDYLMHHGVPETQPDRRNPGTDTAESAESALP